MKKIQVGGKKVVMSNKLNLVANKIAFGFHLIYGKETGMQIL